MSIYAKEKKERSQQKYHDFLLEVGSWVIFVSSLYLSVLAKVFQNGFVTKFCCMWFFKDIIITANMSLSI